MTNYLGLTPKKPKLHAGKLQPPLWRVFELTAGTTGSVRFIQEPLSPFAFTKTGTAFPDCVLYTEQVRRNESFHSCSSVIMTDGSPGVVGQFYVIRGSNGSLFIGRLIEVLVAARSVAAYSHQAGSIIVEKVDVSTEAVAYRMPRALLTAQYVLVDIKVCLSGLSGCLCMC